MTELLRHARLDDAEAVAAIYNQGIEERQATFETRLRQPHDLDVWLGEAEQRGYWKLIGLLFSSNTGSLKLIHRCGFREVGTHRRHGRLDGEWRDVLVVERLLEEAASRT